MNQIHPMQDPYAVNSTGQPQELFGSESLQIPLLSILVALGPKSAFLKLPLCMAMHAEAQNCWDQPPSEQS